MTLLLTLAFLDRTNIGNARVAGMDTDLGLSSSQYNICLMVRKSADYQIRNARLTVTLDVLHHVRSL